MDHIISHTVIVIFTWREAQLSTYNGYKSFIFSRWHFEKCVFEVQALYKSLQIVYCIIYLWLTVLALDYHALFSKVPGKYLKIFFFLPIYTYFIHTQVTVNLQTFLNWVWKLRVEKELHIVYPDFFLLYFVFFLRKWIFDPWWENWNCSWQWIGIFLSYFINDIIQMIQYTDEGLYQIYISKFGLLIYMDYITKIYFYNPFF